MNKRLCFVLSWRVRGAMVLPPRPNSLSLALPESQNLICESYTTCRLFHLFLFLSLCLSLSLSRTRTHSHSYGVVVLYTCTCTCSQIWFYKAGAIKCTVCLTFWGFLHYTMREGGVSESHSLSLYVLRVHPNLRLNCSFELEMTESG